MTEQHFNPIHEDPMLLFDRWLQEAEAAEINDPNAMALATVSEDGWPSVRMVLLKGRDAEGFHFYTNFTSRKAAELDATGKAALCFHWKSLRRQLRVVGPVSRLPAEIADDYYLSRPLGSRIGAWASDQSSPLESRQVLAARVAAMEKQHGSSPSRPPFWGGYHLAAQEIEFWQDGESRLHDRFRFSRTDTGWACSRLYP